MRCRVVLFARLALIGDQSCRLMLLWLAVGGRYDHHRGNFLIWLPKEPQCFVLEKYSEGFSKVRFL